MLLPGTILSVMHFATKICSSAQTDFCLYHAIEISYSSIFKSANNMKRDFSARFKGVWQPIILKVDG